MPLRDLDDQLRRYCAQHARRARESTPCQAGTLRRSEVMRRGRVPSTPVPLVIPCPKCRPGSL